MFHFTIRDVENLSGIKAHTLRMWEQRYGLCVCKRKESLHRYYDNEDLKHILRIAYLYHNGCKISRIARFSHQEVIQEATAKSAAGDFGITVNELVAASVDYNAEQFEQILHDALCTVGFENSMKELIFPFLDKIGLLWMTGHVLPAQEHFCSYLIQKKILTAINALPPVNESVNRFLLFTPEGEEHELSLLFIQYIMKKKGIKGVLLGKNVSIHTIQLYCMQQPVSHLYFHLITNFTHCSPEHYLSRLSAAFADKQIIASGRAVQDVEQMPANVKIIRSLHEAMAFDFGS